MPFKMDDFLLVDEQPRLASPVIGKAFVGFPKSANAGLKELVADLEPVLEVAYNAGRQEAIDRHFNALHDRQEALGWMRTNGYSVVAGALEKHWAEQAETRAEPTPEPLAEPQPVAERPVTRARLDVDGCLVLADPQKLECSIRWSLTGCTEKEALRDSVNATIYKAITADRAKPLEWVAAHCDVGVHAGLLVYLADEGKIE